MKDLPDLVRAYFLALDGHADGCVSRDDLETAEMALRHAVWKSEVRLELALRRVGWGHRPPQNFQARVWERIEAERKRSAAWWRRAGRWLGMRL